MIFFIRLSRLVIPYNVVQKSLRRWEICYTLLYGVTKQLSRIKKIINFHHQFFKRYPTPSAINVKNHVHISDLDSQAKSYVPYRCFCLFEHKFQLLFLHICNQISSFSNSSHHCFISCFSKFKIEIPKIVCSSKNGFQLYFFIFKQLLLLNFDYWRKSNISNCLILDPACTSCCF